MSTLFRGLIALALLAPLAGCPDGEGDEASGADEYFYDCESAPAGVTVYATDESFRAIADKESARSVTVSDAEAATVVSPAPGATLSASTPPTFMLRTPTAALVPPGPGGCPPRRPRWWQRLSPVGVAHAHCPGVTGDNMLVRLTPAGSTTAAYTALVSVTSFTPRADRWRAAMGRRKGQTMTLTILRAGLAGGRVTIGPFAPSQSASFNVGD